MIGDVVLIPTSGADTIIDDLCPLLESRGLVPVLLKSGGYGSEWNLTWAVGKNGLSFILHANGVEIRETDIRSVYARHDFAYFSPPTFLATSEEDYFRLQQSLHLTSFFRWLSGRFPFMNPPDANMQMASKMAQMQLALDVGLRVPETLVGDNPDMAAIFQTQSSADLCVKALEATTISKSGEPALVQMTKRFERRSRNELEALRPCPVILQHFVRKALEYRVTVVNDQIFACGIDTSKANADAQDDFRHYDWANTPHTVVELPDILTKRLLEFMRRSGLVFGAFDLVLDHSGEIWFLEVNPQGQWLWVEDLTGMPITSAVADWLSQPF